MVAFIHQTQVKSVFVRQVSLFGATFCYDLEFISQIACSTIDRIWGSTICRFLLPFQSAHFYEINYLISFLCLSVQIDFGFHRDRGVGWNFKLDILIICISLIFICLLMLKNEIVLGKICKTPTNSSLPCPATNKRFYSCRWNWTIFYAIL